MTQNQNPSPNPILVALIAAVAVFGIGLIGMAIGVGVLNQSAAPTPTVDIAQLPLTPLPTATTPPAVDTPTPEPTPTSTPSPTAALTPTNTPTLAETATPTLEPTAESTPTSEPSATPDLPPTPYAGPLRKNGGNYTAARNPGIVADGVLGDWAGIPAMPLTFIQLGAENWDGPVDFSINTRVVWDDAFLYVAAEVVDDVHVQTMRGYNMFNGDSIELWLDVRLAEDFDDSGKNGDDFQIGFSPGDFAGNGAEGVIWYPNRVNEWNQQLQVAAQQQSAGYTLEAAIPWSVLGIRPGSGVVFGFAANANDNDAPGTAGQQTTLMHTAGMAWGRPDTFSNLRIQ